MAGERDYGFLWAWEPVRPAELPELLAGLAAPWWVTGGSALDLFLGRETRSHEDLDIALLRRDQLALHRHLRGWDLRYATPQHTLEPWDASYLEPPVTRDLGATLGAGNCAVDVRIPAERGA